MVRSLRSRRHRSLLLCGCVQSRSAKSSGVRVGRCWVSWREGFGPASQDDCCRAVLRRQNVLLVSQLVKNLRALSTSAPAPSVRVDRKVSRRGTCDRGIWTKSLAFAADAEEFIFLYGFSMPVSPFDRLGSSRSRIVAGRGLAR